MRTEVPDAVAEDLGHGWVSHSDWHSRDQRLRRFRFRILSRVSGQEARWVRDGKVWTEDEAVRQCDRETKSVERVK